MTQRHDSTKVHSALRLARAGARLAVAIVVLAFTSSGVGQAPTTNSKGKLPTFRITEWEDERAGAQKFLGATFPDIYRKSTMIFEESPGAGFAVHLCELDFSGPIEECALFAHFLVTQPRFGKVPAWIHIGVREHDQRWNCLAVLLAAHPEWTAAEVRDAMKINGFKYGDWNRSGVKKAFKKAQPKLEPFFGKLKVDSIVYSEFNVRDRKFFKPPVWIVEAHPRGLDKADSVSYSFRIDAMDGRISGVN